MREWRSMSCGDGRAVRIPRSMAHSDIDRVPPQSDARDRLRDRGFTAGRDERSR